jgi:transcription elongation factor GreA
MASHLTVSQAMAEYLQSLKNDLRSSHEPYIRKYVEYTGETFLVSALTGSRVESYAESQIRASDPAAPERVAVLKAWFQYLKKKDYTEANYGIHIRVRKPAGRVTGGTTIRGDEQPIEMTQDGITSLQAQVELLNAERLELRQAMEIARSDGDLRENAPYHAARERLGLVETQHRQLSESLRRAVLVDRADDDRANVGSMVRVTNVDDNRTHEYRLVSAREANATEKKISVESPVGRQLLGRRPGDEVTVDTPRGQIRFRIEAVATA